jgi:hypothetical protein
MGRKMAIRNRREGEGARPEGRCAVETAAQQWVVLENGGEECGPATDSTQAGAPDDEAEIGCVAFDKREAPIAAWE